MKRYIVALAIVAAGLALLLANRGTGETLGIGNDDFARLVSLLPFATLFGVSILLGRRQALGKVMRDLLAWLVIILAIVVGWLYRGDLLSLSDRVLAALVPGRPVVSHSADGGAEVVLYKTMSGHFEADVEVNGQTVSMLVDTGASAVALSWEDARAFGLNPENLDYTATVTTANGEALAAPVKLAQISLGSITRRNVDALVASEGRLDQSLLGMSFLSTLDAIHMQDDEMRLRD